MPASCDGATPPTRHRGHVTPPRHLDEHRCPAFQRGPGGPQRHRRKPGGPCGGVALLGEPGVIECDDAGCFGTDRRPGRDQIMRPAAGDQGLCLRRAGVTTDECRTPQLVGAQHGDLPGMRVGRTWFGQTVVTVVPHHHHTEFVHRRENRTAGADHQPGLPAQHRQPPPVPGRRPQSCCQRHHRGFVDQRGGSRQQRIDIALVGNDDQHTVAAADRSRGGFGQAVAPALPGQHLPHRPGRAALVQCVEEFAAAGIATPPCRIDGLDHRQQGNLALCFLRRRVSRRDGQPQHIRAGAGVARRDCIHQPPHLTGEHRLGGDHPIQPAQLTHMVGIGATFEYERIDQPAVKTNPHPHSRLSIIGLLRRDQIIELAIQVRHRQHGQNPGDGLVFGGVPAGGTHLLPSTGVATDRRSSDIGSMWKARRAPTRKVSPTEMQIARITRCCSGVMARSFLASLAVEPPIPESAGVVTAASSAPRDAQNLRRLSSRGARCPGTAYARCIPTPPRTRL